MLGAELTDWGREIQFDGGSGREAGWNPFQERRKGLVLDCRLAGGDLGIPMGGHILVSHWYEMLYKEPPPNSVVLHIT